VKRADSALPGAPPVRRTRSRAHDETDAFEDPDLGLRRSGRRKTEVDRSVALDPHSQAVLQRSLTRRSLPFFFPFTLVGIIRPNRRAPLPLQMQRRRMPPANRARCVLDHARRVRLFLCAFISQMIVSKTYLWFYCGRSAFITAPLRLWYER
jgi:hypothetical protein